MTNKELERANELNRRIREYEDTKFYLKKWVNDSKNKFVLKFPNPKQLFVRKSYPYEVISFEANNEMLCAILKEIERQTQELREEFETIGK